MAFRNVEAGMNVARLNFSHGTAQDHRQRAETVREICRKTGRTVGIMGDLQGPKIRVGKFKDGKVTLKAGDEFILDADCELGDGQRATVMARLRERRLEAGETLFDEGDAADCLYVLTRGSISVLSRPDAAGRTQRYLSISPGMVFGELAMLDGAGRSAGAVADRPATVHALMQRDLDALTREQPALAAQLYRNIAVHLSQRFRSATAAWNASQR